MLQILFYILLAAAAVGAIYVAALFVKGYLNGTPASSVLFGPKPERRLDVVEHASIDGRRRLVLIRRDEVEHLIMTGGPVDVVIETNIAPQRRRPAEVVEAPNAVYARAPRQFGQAVGDN